MKGLEYFLYNRLSVFLAEMEATVAQMMNALLVRRDEENSLFISVAVVDDELHNSECVSVI